MRQAMLGIMVTTVLAALAGTAAAQGAKPLKKCPSDSVIAGTVCMDKYEASVWNVPDPTGANKGLVTKIQQGKVTLEQLQAAGATQRGVSSDNYGSACADDGFNCLRSATLYAVSLPGVPPARFITWFQASAFCANSRKRLPTNAEWQVAALAHGLNADADCNISSGDVMATGANADCISDAGAYDTTGNLYEWVAEWVPKSTAGCPGWGTFANDSMCLDGASTTAPSPGALQRGGHFDFTGSGPLAVRGTDSPATAFDTNGFRCAR